MSASKNSCNKLSDQFKLKAVECAKSLDVQLQRKNVSIYSRGMLKSSAICDIISITKNKQPQRTIKHKISKKALKDKNSSKTAYY